MSSAYSTEFAERLKRAYFLQRVKIASKQLQREQRKPAEYYEKHFCERNYSGHDFQPFSPHSGCAKMVCRFCAKESPQKTFRASVYAHKGRSFTTKKKKTEKRKTKKREKTESVPEKTESVPEKTESVPEKTESEQEWE